METFAAGAPAQQTVRPRHRNSSRAGGAVRGGAADSRRRSQLMQALLFSCCLKTTLAATKNPMAMRVSHPHPANGSGCSPTPPATPISGFGSPPAAQYITCPHEPTPASKSDWFALRVAEGRRERPQASKLRAAPGSASKPGGPSGDSMSRRTGSTADSFSLRATQVRLLVTRASASS